MLLTTIIGSGIVILDGTVVNVALPHIARDLGASFSQLQWIVDGYLLSLSSLIIIGGSLGDILGRKRMYFIGLFGFGVTSLLCGLALINTNFPSDLRGLAIGISGVLGPALPRLLDAT